MMTKRLVFSPEETSHRQRYSADVERLVRVAESAGYGLSEEDAYKAWAAHSDSMAAGWLALDDDDAVLLSILRYELEEIDA